MPETDTICDAILLDNILFLEKFMPFLKHFCRHKQLLRTLASFKYPAMFLNVVAFPVFIFPPPGPLAQQTGWGFFFWLCLPGTSIPGGAALAEPAQGCVETPAVVMGMPGGPGGDACAGAASSPSYTGGRNRNFLRGRLMGPTASPLPSGAGQQVGTPPRGHPFPRLLCALGSRCVQQPG